MIYLYCGFYCMDLDICREATIQMSYLLPGRMKVLMAQDDDVFSVPCGFTPDQHEYTAFSSKLYPGTTVVNFNVNI